MSQWCLLNHRTFCYQTRYGYTTSWARVSNRKNWFTVFSVKVTTRAYIIKIWLHLLYHLNCWAICNQLDLIVQHHKPEHLEKIGSLHSRSRSQWRFKMSMNVCLDNILWTADHFVTILGMVMQHHEPECHGEKIVCYLQGQGHSEGSYDQHDSWSDGAQSTK